MAEIDWSFEPVFVFSSLEGREKLSSGEIATQCQLNSQVHQCPLQMTAFRQAWETHNFRAQIYEDASERFHYTKQGRRHRAFYLPQE